MNRSKNLRVSIVIPVYNEADYLDACLQAIAALTEPPFEVIVVDNNSTDQSAAVAAQYPFVRLLHEPRQGVVYARTRGFNAARGEIIGRIDADTLLTPDWVTAVTAIFADPDIAAVSGLPHYYDVALSGVVDAIDHRLRRYLATKLGDTNFLWGANMAVRRSAWRQVRGDLCYAVGMHEDFDLGIHLQDHSLSVIYDTSLQANVSSRRIDTTFADYVRYSLVSPRTYAQHQLLSRIYMYPVVYFTWLCYIPGRLLFKAYDPATGQLSLNYLRTPATARVDPTTNVL